MKNVIYAEHIYIEIDGVKRKVIPNSLFFYRKIKRKNTIKLNNFLRIKCENKKRKKE